LLKVREELVQLHSYIKIKRLGLTPLNRAQALRLLLRRKGGALLETMQLRGGNRRSKSNRRPTLEQLGLKLHESKMWQKLAAIPEEVFQRYLRSCRKERQKVSTSGFLKFAAHEEKAKGDADARQRSSARSSTIVGELRARLHELRSIAEHFVGNERAGESRRGWLAVNKLLGEVQVSLDELAHRLR
jgi:hypothetical protein